MNIKRQLFRVTKVLPFLAAMSILSLATFAWAASAVNKNGKGVAIEGYDPVAYFAERNPVRGNKNYTFEYRDATWQFSSARNKKIFVENPAKYVPRYGGYCAYAVSQGYTAKIDPNAWTVYNDKLYLNYSIGVRDGKWSPKKDLLIKRADQNWPSLHDDSASQK